MTYDLKRQPVEEDKGTGLDDEKIRGIVDEEEDDEDEEFERIEGDEEESIDEV